jgi:uncharacterized protein YndB with AHSA1/START domain
MLGELGSGRRTISDFAAKAAMTFAAVSRHLRVLEEAGLVSRAIVGREHYFSAQPEALGATRDWIDLQSRQWQSRLDTLKTLMETEMTETNALVAHAEIHIAATPAKVFAAWLDPKIAGKFMGGDSAAAPGIKLDPRPGGELFLPMKFGDREIPHRGEFLLVDAPRRLVFTWLSPNTQLRTTVVAVDFVAERGGTRLTVTHEGFADAADASGHSGGWASIIGQLAAVL